ncbi:hypothetical protein AAHB37_14520 [Glutamicibacter halophytocola]|uniref:hypothetical protein n=1 Tax=Glutamicibacter halophytocola TaxID=1933880 RepID=UPI003219B44B
MSVNSMPGHPGGPAGGGRMKNAVQDRQWLAEHPVSLQRVAALFRPHLGSVLAVVLLIAASSIIGLAQPFIVRELIDVAIPQSDIRFLVLGAGGLVAIALATAVLEVLQTWRATLMGRPRDAPVANRALHAPAKAIAGIFHQLAIRRRAIPADQ